MLNNFIYFSENFFMEVNILQLLDGARDAKGLTVIIDVFRAFSTACYAYDRGASRIFPIGEIGKAYDLKSRNPDYVLVGERNEQKKNHKDSILVILRLIF